MPRRAIVFASDETERLIELVRRNACLFDLMLPGYQAQLVSKTWSLIAQVLRREEFDGKIFCFSVIFYNKMSYSLVPITT